uniref:Poly(A)-specific ribonuclease n=1 Tax=Panagrolaimus sp. ES5 TaxID=591445 RepID=A0AC34FR71_9BILA
MSTPQRLALATSKGVTIHDVWNDNVEEEFSKIRDIIHEYPYIAFDTEFPGVVATPIGAFKCKEEFQYNQIACNVNMLKLIQVGFCLTNSKGELPPNGDIWQFNIKFSIDDDMYAVESVDLLRRSGIDFTRLQTDGISIEDFGSLLTTSGLVTDGICIEDFGSLLTTSGLVVNKKITWLTFHSCFDFGYLIKTVIGRSLPTSEKTFFEYHKALFPRSYDVKMLMKVPKIQAAKLRGGLQDIADQLSVKRIGFQHQAGSDALLTARTFFKLREKFFNNDWVELESQFQGYMFGLGAAFTSTLTELPMPVTKFNSHPLQTNDDDIPLYPLNLSPQNGPPPNFVVPVHPQQQRVEHQPVNVFQYFQSQI